MQKLCFASERLRREALVSLKSWDMQGRCQLYDPKRRCEKGSGFHSQAVYNVASSPKVISVLKASPKEGYKRKRRERAEALY